MQAEEIAERLLCGLIQSNKMDHSYDNLVSSKNKEDKSMKSTAIRRSNDTCRRFANPYPNAASPRYLLGRILDVVLTAVTSFGVVAIILFLFTLA